MAGKQGSQPRYVDGGGLQQRGRPRRSQKWVDQANEGVSRAESVRKFIILPEEFTQENGLMTASMKVIRPKVIKRYATLLNTQMYTKKK